MIPPRLDQRLAFLGAALLLASLASCTTPTDLEQTLPSVSGEVQARILADSRRGAEVALDGVVRNLTVADAEMGAGESSELAELNRRAADGFYQVNSFDLYKMLLLSMDYAKASGGAFDPTVGAMIKLYRRPGGRLPTDAELTLAQDRVGWSKVTVAGEAQAVRFNSPGMSLDLERLASAYSLDIATRGLAGGARAGLLSRDDSLYAWGAPAGSRGWKISIPDPREPERSVGTLTLRHRGLSVQGLAPTAPPKLYDPRTGRPPATDLAVAVAIADTAADANAIAQALYVLGSRGGGDLLSGLAGWRGFS